MSGDASTNSREPSGERDHFQAFELKNLLGGIPWYTYPSEKYDFVSWDDDIPNILD